VFINIHSHQPEIKNEFVIQNLLKDFNQLLSPGYYSAGLHPWHLESQNWQQQLLQLKKISTAENILALGECGLDKVCKTDFKLQQEVFITQILWANEINKPLIIHCVQAFSELGDLLKKYNNKTPVIFHGFNKNSRIAEKMLNDGHYLSFGKSILQLRNKVIFEQVPLNRIFLETDETNISIEEIYKEAAAIKNISLETLSLQIEKNVQLVFNINLQ
jgi:TatD DNase family protein